MEWQGFGLCTLKFFSGFAAYRSAVARACTLCCHAHGDAADFRKTTT
jgi:hypothetical protein